MLAAFKDPEVMAALQDGTVLLLIFFIQYSLWFMMFFSKLLRSVIAKEIEVVETKSRFEYFAYEF